MLQSNREVMPDDWIQGALPIGPMGHILAGVPL
jgi:hypothetical protein